MSERTDTDTGRANSDSLSRETVVFELARASYALGIGGVVLTALVFVVSFLGFGGSEVAVLTVFSIGLCLPVVLYVYDRRHERDFVIAELGHAMVRPCAILYRILRGP